MNNEIKPETLLAQGAGAHDAATGGVAPAIQLSSTYLRGPDNALLTQNFYARYATPNGRQAETAIAQLEGAADARLFSSGMAAALAAIPRTLPAHAHVVATRRGYFSIVAWLMDQHERGALDVSFFDPRFPETLAGLMRKGETQLVWIETPVNPVYEVVDIAAAAETAHGAGALLGVDSTAATPLLTRPIEHGADLVFHSATKYLNGHSDVLAGVLCTRDKTLPLWGAVEERTVGGASLGGFEAWLLLRGMRTMHLRVRQQCENALRIARELEAHAAVERVTYPGLASHPQHAIAARQMQGGFGGMMSFEVKGAAAGALGVISRLKLIKVATSLGGVETLIEHRRSIEGPHSDVADGLLRLSVGCEHVDDIWADLNAALSAR